MNLISKPVIFVALAILLSCRTGGEGRMETEVTLFHEAINEIVNAEPGRGLVIQGEVTTPLFMNSASTRKISLAGDLFRVMTREKLISPLDTTYLSSQLDSTKIVKLDPEKLTIPMITEVKAKEIFQRGWLEGWKTFKDEYGDKCILRLSSPIFNSDKSIIVFASYKTCYGDIHGIDFRYVLKRVNGHWNILNEI